MKGRGTWHGDTSKALGTVKSSSSEQLSEVAFS